jgi:hypothetical protein
VLGEEQEGVDEVEDREEGARGADEGQERGGEAEGGARASEGAPAEEGVGGEEGVI